MYARPDVVVRLWDKPHDETLLQQTLGGLFGRDALDLEADQARAGRTRCAEGDARVLREQVHQPVGATVYLLESRVAAFGGGFQGVHEAAGQGGAHRGRLEAPGAGVQLVVALWVEGLGVGDGEVTEVRAVDPAFRPYVEGAHPFRAEQPLVAGDGVHVGAGRGRVYRNVAGRLGAVYQGQGSVLAG